MKPPTTRACPIPTPEARRSAEIQGHAERVLLAKAQCALDGPARRLQAVGEDRPPSRGWFASVVHQALDRRLCGADPDTFAGGDPKTALAMIRNAENVARPYRGADIPPDPDARQRVGPRLAPVDAADPASWPAPGLLRPRVRLAGGGHRAGLATVEGALGHDADVAPRGPAAPRRALRDAAAPSKAPESGRSASRGAPHLAWVPASPAERRHPTTHMRRSMRLADALFEGDRGPRPRRGAPAGL